MTRIGPKMRAAVEYVKAHPGCVMRDCAHAVNPHPIPSKNEALGYNIVHRAIDAGLIEYERLGGKYYLWTPEDLPS